MPEFASNTIQLHVAAFDKDSEEYRYLLLQRSASKMPYPNIWQVITGTIEEDEKAIDTALRELNEEAGLTPSKIWTLPYITSFFNPHIDQIHMSPVFGVLVDSNHVIRISHEHQKYQWLSYSDCINRLVLPSHRDGTKIFRDYALNEKLSNLYEYKELRK
jgi:dihydroneopterin triphosphate diphosphatase